MPIDEELKGLMEIAANKLVATHRITVEAMIGSDCLKKSEIEEQLLNWKEVSLELLQVENGKMKIVLFYTSDISNAMKTGIVKIESEEEVLEIAYFHFQRHIPFTYVKIKKEDIKVKQLLLPEEENQFLVLF